MNGEIIMPIASFDCPWMQEEHRIYADSVTRFLTENWVPRVPDFMAAGQMPRETWNEAGAAGLLCAAVPEEFGGLGGDFGHEAVVCIEAARANVSGFGGSMHSGIVAPYIVKHGTDEQRRRWLPKMATGDLVGALAMTEPGTGSDVQSIRTNAVREGEFYRLNGAKTFITNGQNADLILVACKTDKSEGARGVSLLAVETEGLEGFRRGRNLDKIGLKSQDTSELFFEDCLVPAENLLGGVEGQGFVQMMTELPQERLIIALNAIGAMERAIDDTIAYCKEREAFGKPIIHFQNTRFKLVECKTHVLAARSFVDTCMVAHLDGKLGVDRAAMAKYWVSEMQGKVIDECLQLFGGYGYMMEYPIAQLYVDARVQRIYGGTNEIMKELASRSL
ncbi:acyl-CoA dehydrogenase family protein [Rhodobacteraceae bacterium NNCM2]|nr:acyl-CoA dehydrogenase family protein [Coraliihabitans acroporae]